MFGRLFFNRKVYILTQLVITMETENKLEHRRCDGCGELQRNNSDDLFCNEYGDAWCYKCFKKVGVRM